MATGKAVQAIKTGSDQAGIAALSPDGKVVTVGGYADGTFHTWEVASGKELPQVMVGRDMVYGLAFTPDGKTLATSGISGTVSLWDVASGKSLRAFDGQQGKRGRFVFSGGGFQLAFSPDGKALPSAGRDGKVIIWDVAKQKPRVILKGHGKHKFGDMLSCIAFAPDGRTVVSGSWDGTIRFWPVAPAKQPKK